MAQESSEASVASSSPTPIWWEIHTNPVSSSWNSMNRWQPHSNSASCEDQDLSNISTTSFANASNTHSELSMDSSSADLQGEPPENQLWSQVLFDVGNGGGDSHNSHGNGESFLEILSSKSLATEMFNPACDYLRKLDSSWEFTDPSPLNSIEKHLNSYNNRTVVEPERLNNVSGLVGNWSIAPPNTTCNAPLNAARLPNSPPFLGNGSTGYNLTNSYVHGIKGESQHQEHVGGPHRNGAMGSHQICLNNSMIGLGNSYRNGISPDASWSNNARNLSDLISFGSCLNKPAMQFRATAGPSGKGSVSMCDDSKKQGCEISPPLQTNRSGRGSGTTSEGKKKRSEESSETLFKKAKHESSDAYSIKVQPPKVKLGERITALQQIVSPFGKTDTASVLLEAINYIRFLQEQVQLLSDPYLKSSSNKDHNSWRGVERKDKADAKLDLRSRGLCLVPISCTPQVCRENSGPDYWTPTYRGCLYR